MKHTNKKFLSSGIKYLGGAIPLTFIGPVVLYSAFNNQNHPLYIPVVILGGVACLAALFLIFKGIGNLMKSLFD